MYRVREMFRPLLALTVVMATFACPLAATGVFSSCHADEAPMECCDRHQAAAPQSGGLAPLDPLAALADLASVPTAPQQAPAEPFAARAPLHPPRSHDPDRLTVFRI